MYFFSMKKTHIDVLTYVADICDQLRGHPRLQLIFQGITVSSLSQFRSSFGGYVYMYVCMYIYIYVYVYIYMCYIMYIQFSDKPICWTLKVGIPVLFGGCTHVAMRIRILDWSWAHAEISCCDVTSVVASFSISGADTYINIYIFKTAVAKEHVWRTQSNEATKLWVHWILWISSIHTLASLTPVAAQLKRQLTCYMINIDATKVGGPLTILRLLERPSEDDFCLISVENFPQKKLEMKKIKGKMHLHAFLHVLDLVCCSLNWILAITVIWRGTCVVDVCPWTAWVSGWTVGDWTHEVWSDMTSVGNLLLQVFTTKGHGRHQVWTQHSPRKPQRYSTHTEVRRLRDSELHTFVETTTIFWQQWNVLIENCIRSNMGPRFWPVVKSYRSSQYTGWVIGLSFHVGLIPGASVTNRFDSTFCMT